MTSSKKIYLIDLDGTLLKANSLFFLANVFYIFKNFFPVLGFKTFKVLIPSLKQLINNKNPDLTNFQALSESLQRLSHGLDLQKPLWNFYRNDFPKLSVLCSAIPESAQALQRLKDRGHKIYLTTNPIWPEECVHLRLKWAQVPYQLFDGITHSQNWSSCKPQLSYYQRVLDFWKLSPSDCILIGDNDRKEGPAAQLGIEVVILNPNQAPNYWKTI